MAMARGSIGMHCAWDDTTALIRISERNDVVSHSGIARFHRVNGHEWCLNLQKSCECNLGIAVQEAGSLGPAFSLVEKGPLGPEALRDEARPPKEQNHRDKFQLITLPGITPRTP
jgi:hypothetical protein